MSYYGHTLSLTCLYNSVLYRAKKVEMGWYIEFIEKQVGGPLAGCAETARQIAGIFGTHTYVSIGVSYIPYGSTPQPMAVMAPINVFAAPKTVFGLLLLYYPFDGHFTWYSAKYSIDEHISFILASIYASITGLFCKYILSGLAIQHTRNRPYSLFLSWKHGSLVQ